MGEKTIGEHTNITIRAEDGYFEKAAKGLPVAGGAVTAIDGIIDGDTNNTLINAASFVQSCRDTIQMISSDPLGLLVSNGLDFLLAIFQPLQDWLHVVTGDGPALRNAAGNFGNIGKGLQNLGEDLPKEAVKRLNQWKGPASTAAHDRIEEFSDGVLSVAAMSGNIAALLQASSMFMTVIEEVVKAFISELAAWMLELWIPALAASGPTFGGSISQASMLSWLKANQTVVRTANKADDAAILKNMVGAAFGNAQDVLKGQLTDPVKAVKNLAKVGLAIEYQATGDSQSVTKTREQLDF